MFLTANPLYRDTVCQFRQQLKPLVLLSLLSAFVTVILLNLFLPSIEPLVELLKNSDNTIAALKNMSQEQRVELMHISSVMTFSALIGNTLLIGGVLKLLAAATAGRNLSALGAIGASAGVWPRLFIQIFLLTTIIELGFYAMIIPGIFLLILFSLSPVLLLEKDKGLLKTMKRSVPLVWKNFRIIAPAVMGWLIVKLILTFLFGAFGLAPSSVVVLMSNVLSHLVSALLLIYLFRVNAQIR